MEVINYQHFLKLGTPSYSCIEDSKQKMFNLVVIAGILKYL